MTEFDEPQPFPRAVGYIRLDLAGRRTDQDARNITVYAAHHDFALVKVLEVSAGLRDPVRVLITAMDKHDATIILTPTGAHVAGLTGRQLTEKWDLHVLESGNIYLQGHRWPPLFQLERQP